MVSISNSGAIPSGESESVQEQTIHVAEERARWPRLAPDVELVGRVQDSAFDEEQWLICFDDSNYIQSTPLLYHVLHYSDGNHSVEDIARSVRADTGIEVTGEDVEWLILNRLIPSGLLDLGVDEEEYGEGPRPAELPVLALRWRIPLFPYEWTVPFADLFKHLYWPPLMVAVVIAAIAINVWIFIDATVLVSAQELLFRPEFILVLFALDLASTLFHELGHAAALRRAGARYGWIGAALYVIFPVFYTDVTHIYRLNRRERIRVDLGGMYFELIMMIVFFGLYHATGNGIFLIGIVLTTLSFLQQFTPFLRFDGYYTIADIMGVNEPLSIVKPYLRDQIPWPRDREKSLPNMRTGPRIAFAVYLFAIVVFLTYPLFIGAFAGRQFARTLFESGSFLWNQMIAAWRDGEILLGTVTTLQFFFWLLIPLGLTLFTIMLIRRFGHGLIALGRLALSVVNPAPLVRSSRAFWAATLVLIGLLITGGGIAIATGTSIPWVDTLQRTGASSETRSASVTEPASPGISEPASSMVSSDVDHRAFSDLHSWYMTYYIRAFAEPAATEASSVPESPALESEPSETTAPAPFTAPAWHFGAQHAAPFGGSPEHGAYSHSGVGGMLTHVVEPNESLTAIAERYGTTIEEIVILNGITDPDLIFEGQTIQIPQ